MIGFSLLYCGVYSRFGLPLGAATCREDKNRKNVIAYEFLYQRFLFVCFSICNTLLWLSWFSEMSFLIKVLHGLQFCKLKWIKIGFVREFHDTLNPHLEIIGDTLGYHRPISGITTLYASLLVCLWKLNWQQQFIKRVWLSAHSLLTNLQGLGEPRKTAFLLPWKLRPKGQSWMHVHICV